jgi:hypothetical protein
MSKLYESEICILVISGHGLSAQPYLKQPWVGVGLISSTFLVKSKWQKAQSHQQIAEKLELCAENL